MCGKAWVIFFFLSSIEIEIPRQTIRSIFFSSINVLIMEFVFIDLKWKDKEREKSVYWWFADAVVTTTIRLHLSFHLSFQVWLANFFFISQTIFFPVRFVWEFIRLNGWNTLNTMTQTKKKKWKKKTTLAFAHNLLF